jgi:hypothetical protein
MLIWWLVFWLSRFVDCSQGQIYWKSGTLNSLKCTCSTMSLKDNICVCDILWIKLNIKNQFACDAEVDILGRPSVPPLGPCDVNFPNGNPSFRLLVRQMLDWPNGKMLLSSLVWDSEESSKDTAIWKAHRSMASGKKQGFVFMENEYCLWNPDCIVHCALMIWSGESRYLIFQGQPMRFAILWGESLDVKIPIDLWALFSRRSASTGVVAFASQSHRQHGVLCFKAGACAGSGFLASNLKKY